MAVFSLAAPAWAQRAGVNAGAGRVHPSFELYSSFDDAVAAAVVGTTAGALAQDLILHLKPAVRLDLPSPKLALTGGAHVDYNWFLGVSSPTTTALSFLAAAADLSIGINRGGAVTYELIERFVRSDRSTNVALAAGILSIYNEVTPFKLAVRPGGGAITIEGSYTFILEDYENRTLGCADPATPEFRDLAVCTELTRALAVATYHTHRVKAEGRWRFFPKTALVLDASLDVRRYPDQVAGAPQNVPSTPLRVTTGLTGLLTPKLSLILKVGYGDALIRNGFASVIGHAELALSPSETVNFKLGYVRSFDAIATALAWYGSDRVFLDLAMLLAGRLGVRLGGSADFLAYGGGSNRTDQNISFGASVDYEILAWLRAGLSYTFTHHNAENAGQTLGTRYNRNEGGLRVVAEY